MNQTINELGKCPVCLANLGKFWIGECNLDLKPMCFSPSPSKCRPWGQLDARVGWEGEREMDVWSKLSTQADAWKITGLPHQPSYWLTRE